MAINQILTDKPPTGFPTLRRHWQGAACGKLLKIHKLLELAQCLAMKIMEFCHNQHPSFDLWPFNGF